MKCSQCGCEDLVEVEFPQETSLIKTVTGLSGYSSSYDIENEVYCDSYICVNCGHFEFFNLELAKQIKEDRIIEAKTKEKINKVENDIIQLNDEVVNIEKQIEGLHTESLNLDITLRRNNEIQASIRDLKNKIENLNSIIAEKKRELIQLKKEIE